jgi:hypothetical protein
MYNQLLDHMKKYSILAKEQFGFRADFSTGNAIHRLINTSFQALNSTSAVGSIFFDLERVFDCLNHNILMTKLKFMVLMVKLNHGLSLILITYIKKQVLVEDSNQLSSSLWGKITDVAQGSVLRPFLFLIYINDLPKIVNEKAIHILFSDDKNILVKGYNLNDFQTNMMNAFNCVYKWLRINSLSLNDNKTHCIQFKTKPNPYMT